MAKIPTSTPTNFYATVQKMYRLVIPKEIREIQNIKEGDIVEIKIKKRKER